jgi:hypothetical protein
MSATIKNHGNNITESFWELTNITKIKESYKIDTNLKYLKFAPMDVLRRIFVQYRFFTRYYITDLAILISKLPFGKLKSILSEILYEELGNGNEQDAHPQLYDDFLESIGISKASLNKEDQDCLQNLQAIQLSLLNKSWAYGVGLRGMGGECLCQVYLATMHEYFSQNVAIIAMHDVVAWKFWDIHIGEIDLRHQQIMHDAINELIITQPEVINDLVNGYLESKEAWDRYWKKIFRAANNQSKNTNETTHG